MKLRFLLWCVMALCLTACNRTADNKTVPATVTENFYKRFEGNIGDKKVILHLNKTGKDYNGFYYADASWLNLLTDTLTGKDSIILFESQYADYYWDKKDQPKLSLKLVNDQLSGKWISSTKDTVLDITLKETYPAGAEKFNTVMFKDSLAAFKDHKNSPKAMFGFIFPKAENAWLDELIRNNLDFKTSGEDWKKSTDELKAEFFRSYNRDVAGESFYADSAAGGHLDYVKYATGHIKYNDNGFVVIDYFRESYTGGAHGYYYSTMLNFDVQQEKLLKLGDVVSADSLTLQKIIEVQFRKGYNIPPGVGLQSVLFDKHLGPNKNFYFNKNGLAFIYNPYEVASYAQGQVIVFIPFQALKSYLVPAFAKRMGL